jgi:hypothetical protein
VRPPGGAGDRFVDFEERSDLHRVGRSDRIVVAGGPFHGETDAHVTVLSDRCRRRLAVDAPYHYR